MKKIIILLIIGISSALFVRAYIIEGIFIASGSMEPTLELNERLFVNKLVYKLRKPRRGEIIVFRSPIDEREFVKRVIAVEGDEIEIREKKVLLNGKIIKEPYIKRTRPDAVFADDNIGPYIVPEGCIFVMGDNRDESKDSRNWVDEYDDPTPFIVLEAIEGRTMGVN